MSQTSEKIHDIAAQLEVNTIRSRNLDWVATAYYKKVIKTIHTIALNLEKIKMEEP